MPTIPFGPIPQARAETATESILGTIRKNAPLLACIRQNWWALLHRQAIIRKIIADSPSIWHGIPTSAPPRPKEKKHLPLQPLGGSAMRCMTSTSSTTTAPRPSLPPSTMLRNINTMWRSDKMATNCTTKWCAARLKAMLPIPWDLP